MNDDILDIKLHIIKSQTLDRVECKCGICNEVASSKYNCNNSTSEINKYLDEFVYYLSKIGWTSYNNTIYCPTCSKQLQKLLNTSSRPSKIQYYLDIAKEVSKRSTCLRKHYGAIIVKNDSIISTGYNGSPRGTKNCNDILECRREKLKIPRGQCYEMCRSVHAEQNCIINASKEQMIDSQLYLYGCDANDTIIDNLDSCQLCKKMIINAGIKSVIFARPNNGFNIINVDEWIQNDETLTDKFGY